MNTAFEIFCSSPGIKCGESVLLTEEEKSVDYTPDDADLSEEFPSPGELKRPADREHWKDSPLIEDQFEKDGLYKVGPVVVKVFNLSKESDLESYNAIQEECTKEESPTSLIVSEESNFFEGVYYVKLKYCKVKYRDLLNLNK